MPYWIIPFIAVQLLSCVLLFATPWTEAHQTSLLLLSPGVCSKSCSLGHWCHPTISSSVVPFSSCTQPEPASGSFPKSWLFTSGGQSIGASASAPVLIEYSGLISFRTDRLDLFAVQKTPNGSTTIWKYQFFSAQPSLWPNSHMCCVHDYWKNHSFDYMDLCWWSDASASNTVYICHSFSSKEQESFNFVAEVTIHSDFGAQENKICHCFHFSPFYLQRSDRTRCHDLSFLNVVF